MSDTYLIPAPSKKTIFAENFAMPRIMALDFGTKRTGIAVSDELQLIASGLDTVKTEDLLGFLESYFEKEKVELVLVGEPKQKDGSASESEAAIQQFLK